VTLRGLCPACERRGEGAVGHAFALALLAPRRRGGDHGDDLESALLPVIRALEGTPVEERIRWLELLSYIHAPVYHVRHSAEHPDHRQLRRRFGEVPELTREAIRATADLERLNGWLDLVVTAETLEEFGIE